MRALVLSGGLGERLRPLTLETPKPLLPLGGRPLIHYPLLMLKAAGITEIAINVHHLPGAFPIVLGNGKSLGIEITYAPEPVLLGSGGPFLTLKDFFDGQPFVVTNADTILGLDLNGMIAFHHETGSLVTIALHPPTKSDYYSRLEIDDQKRIRRMRLLKGGKPGVEYDDYPPGLELSVAKGLRSYMFCGAYICDPIVLQRMPSNPPISSMRDIFAPMVTEQLPLFGYLHEGLFRTVDDLGGYEALRTEFSKTPPKLSYL